MHKTGIMSDETQKEISKFYADCYKSGWDQGAKGHPYSGRTFHGYYGWLDGEEGKPPRY